MPFNFGGLFNRTPLKPISFDPSRLPRDISVEDPNPEPVVNRPHMGIMDYYNQMKNPTQDSFSDYLNNAPKREDYKPNFGGRLGAILSGISTGLRGGDGYSAARNIVDAPYKQAVSDYDKEGQNLNLKVQLDNQRFDRAGKLYNEAQDTEDKDRDFDLRARGLAEQVANGKMNRAIAQKQFDQMGFEKVVNKEDGHTRYINPFTGESHDLGKTDETPVERDTRDLGLFTKKTQIDFGNSRALHSMDNAAEMARTNRQGEINVDLIDHRAKADTEKKRQALQMQIDNNPKNALSNNWKNLQQAAAADPDLFNYYEIGPDGSVRPTNNGDVNKYNRVKGILSGVGGGTSKPDPLGIRRQ